MTVWAYGRSHRNEYVPANGRFRLIWKLAIWASSCARPTAKIQSPTLPNPRKGRRLELVILDESLAHVIGCLDVAAFEMCSVLGPVIFIATCRSAPALMRLRAALRRKSWGVRRVYTLVLGSYFPRPEFAAGRIPDLSEVPKIENTISWFRERFAQLAKGGRNFFQ